MGYHCRCCDRSFQVDAAEDVVADRQRLEHFGAPCELIQYQPSCPHCGSIQLSDVELCDGCEAAPALVGDDLCRSCRQVEDAAASWEAGGEEYGR